MTSSEKQRGLAFLREFIQNNPPKEKAVLSPWYSRPIFLEHKLASSAVAFFLFVFMITGGTSFAAKYSLPGDILYSVKIDLNEKIETFTAFTPEAKAKVEASHIDQRLIEAETLEVNQKLDTKLKAEIESQLSADLKNTMTHVDTLNNTGKSENATQVKADVEISLWKHKTIIDKILDENQTEVAVASMAVVEDTAATSTSLFMTTMSTTSTTTEQVPTKKRAQNKMKQRQANTLKIETTLQSTTTGTTTAASSTIEILTNNEKSDTYNEAGLDDTPLLKETLLKILKSKMIEKTTSVEE